MKKILLAALLALALPALSQTATSPGVPKCKAATLAKTPCKRFAKPGTQFCAQHNPESPRCGANTKANKPCSRLVSRNGVHCSQHKAE